MGAIAQTLFGAVRTGIDSERFCTLGTVTTPSATTVGEYPRNDAVRSPGRLRDDVEPISAARGALKRRYDAPVGDVAEGLYRSPMYREMASDARRSSRLKADANSASASSDPMPTSYAGGDGDALVDFMRIMLR